jgi:hypothetical protein
VESFICGGERAYGLPRGNEDHLVWHIGLAQPWHS